MNKFKVKKSIILIIFIVILGILNISKANSLDIFNSLEVQDFSKEYSNWLDLPDNEKEKTIMPSMYTIDLEEVSNISNSNLYNISTTSSEALPSKYNTGDNIRITVRNQGGSNSCWAVASSEIFELKYAKDNRLNIQPSFSERHIEYSCSRYFLNNVENEHGYNRAPGSAGNSKMSMAYYTSGKGPILQEDMPFENNKDLIDISQIQNKTVQAQLEDFVEYPQIYKKYDETNNVTYSNGIGTVYNKQQIEEFRNIIKKQILDNGAVFGYTCMPTSIYDENNYFSNENRKVYGTSYFCNNSSAPINHSICIVGWDDNYSRENFKESCRPANDGAYLVLNSYGEDWGFLDGYYYISYDDYLIEKGMLGIKKISDVDYDNIYQYDELGQNTYLSANQKFIYGANVFKREDNSRQLLTEIGLYLAERTDITVYLNQNGTNLNVNNLKIISQQEGLEAGYHTIKLNDSVLLGNTFSIVVKYSNGSNKAVLPLEARVKSSTKYDTAISHMGESFISLDGENYGDLYEYESSKISYPNVCIKAFTTDIVQRADSTKYILNTNWRIIKDSNLVCGIEENTTINSILLKENFNSNYTTKIYKDNLNITSGNIFTGAKIKIYKNSNEVQEYITVIYGDVTGDGTINSVDALAIAKNKLGKESFKSDAHEEAGRVTSNTRTLKLQPSAVDALAIVKYKLGKEQILQN